jgi:hypothetical protein
MRLSQIIRASKREAAEPVKVVGDLRKIFPKRSFKGWKATKNKPDFIWYEKNGYSFRIETDDPELPEIALRWPKSLGEKFIPTKTGWMPTPSGKFFALTTMSNEDDWPEDQKLLKKIALLFTENA